MTHKLEGQTQTHRMPMLTMKPLCRMEAAYGTDGRASVRQMKSCSSDCHKPVWEDSCGVFMKCGWESKCSAWSQRGGQRDTERVKHICSTATEAGAWMPRHWHERDAVGRERQFRPQYLFSTEQKHYYHSTDYQKRKLISNGQIHSLFIYSMQLQI